MNKTQKANFSKFTEIMLLAFPGYIVDTDYSANLLKVKINKSGWIMLETALTDTLNDIRDMLVAIKVYKGMEWNGTRPGYRDLKIEGRLQ